MSFEEKLCAAVRSVIPDAAPNTYEGDARVYASWNYNELPRLHADGRPGAILYLVQVHVYLPRGWPWAEIKAGMCKALFALGGTWPEIIDAGDKGGEHLVFEFETVEALDGQN